MPDVEIRRAAADELEDVGRLTAQVYVGDGFMPDSDDYVRVLQDAAGRADAAELWVAVDGGEVVGTVTFAPVGSAYREIGHHDEGEFRMLAVSPAARGRGVGRALVQHCLDRSREIGYAGVRMSTMDQMTAAHRVYERLSFARSPDDDWSPVPGVVLLAYVLRF
jgi:ribosomal protein S18 acetylase RimI-like enzyme